MLYRARAGGGAARTAHEAGWLLTGETQSEDVVAFGLLGLGAVLIGLAINVMVARARPVAAAMAVLGLLLAGAAVFDGGPLGAFEMLKRLPLCGAPATLLLYWILSIREQDGQLRPRGG